MNVLALGPSTMGFVKCQQPAGTKVNAMDHVQCQGWENLIS